MTLIVVDASVAAKWWFPEPNEVQARLLLGEGIELAAPDFLRVDLSSIIVQKFRRGEVDMPRARAILAESMRMPVAMTRDAGLASQALELALDHYPSAYDCLYAALALRERCCVVTADREFYIALAAPHPGTMLWIEDLPEFLASGA